MMDYPYTVGSILAHSDEIKKALRWAAAMTDDDIEQRAYDRAYDTIVWAEQESERSTADVLAMTGRKA